MRAVNRLLSLVGLALCAAAHAIAAADLLSIYREAQSADAVYAAARASYAAGQEKLPQGLSGLLPVVTFSGNTQYQRPRFGVPQHHPRCGYRLGQYTL